MLSVQVTGLQAADCCRLLSAVGKNFFFFFFFFFFLFFFSYYFVYKNTNYPNPGFMDQSLIPALGLALGSEPQALSSFNYFFVYLLLFLVSFQKKLKKNITTSSTPDIKLI
jgi:hypothetical protein